MQEVFEKIIEEIKEKSYEIQLDGAVVASTKKVAEVQDIVNIVNTISEEYNNGWTPVKYHVVTDREREEKSISEDIVYYLDCKMPDDGEQIIVTDGENMWSDTCFVDICYSLDSGHDWIGDIVAWREMPTKYQPKGE